MTTQVHQTHRITALAVCLALLAGPTWSLAQSSTAASANSQSLDLKRAAPADASMLVYATHNPERDFQRAHWADVMAAVEETDVLNRALQIITSRMDDQELAEATSTLDSFREALAPIDRDALLDAEEFVYAQRMGGMTSHHLLLCRTTPSAADGCRQAIVNLFEMAQRNSDGAITIEVADDGPVRQTTLVLPEGVPFQPSVAKAGDVFLFSSSKQLLVDGLGLALGGDGESKFDDPRLQEALAQLPEPEDAFVFFDGRTHFGKIRGLFDEVSRKAGDNPDAQRAMRIAKKVISEFEVIDSHTTVEYTEGYRFRTTALGRLAPGYEDKLLMKLLGSSEPFEDWESWVPADATGYSLTSGVNLHALYEFVTNLIQEEVPEADEKLERFEAWQAEADFHIDRDLLQSFSGECVSVSLPPADEAGSQQSFTALRCQQPERISELVHRLVEAAQEVPFLESQQIRLEPCEGLEGFEQLSVAMLELFQVRPVIGFRDGWMVLASDPEAVSRVLATRAGEAPSISASEQFQRFGLSVEGPVYSVSYTDLKQSTRNLSKLLTGAGAFLPIVIGAAGVEADPEDLKPLQEIAALLPDVGKIVSKFDFMEAKLYVVHAGPTGDAWLEETSTLIRPPAEEEEAADSQ